jgi:DNA polymerase-3 subunit gamma/tau
MADSHVLARKFRPQSFDQVIGQDAITRTLSNAVKNDRVHHAYIFTGARGVGKTTTARIFAKALNCTKGVTAEPCGVCDSCQDIVASRSMDVLEIDAASNTGVDNVRDVIINSITIAPARDRHKIFIIDEVHMLSAQAFNALLKTVEEPPPRVVFILATTNLEKVPETILSRCQIFEFRTITLKQIVGQLSSIAEKEGVAISESALLAIARAGEGSMRDAESALDQVISFAGATVSDDDVSDALGLVDIETLNNTVQSIADQDSQRLIRIVDEAVSRGYDLRTFCREMMVHIRALLVVKIAGFDSELVQLPESEADTLRRLGESFSEQDLLRFFSILTKTEQDIRNSSQPRFQLEMGLVKLAQARRLFLLEEALGRIEALESRLGGAGAPSSTGRAPNAQRGPRPVQDPPRPSTTSAAAPPARIREGESIPENAQARRKLVTPAVHIAVSPAPSATAAGSAAVRPRASAKPSSPPDPPPPIGELYAVAQEATTLKPVEANTSASSEKDSVEKLKDVLEAKGKMRVVAALEKGTISIEGDYLRVAYAPENSNCKAEIEDRNRRMAIDDACEQVLGRRLTLRVSITGPPDINPLSSSEPISTASGSEPISIASGSEPISTPSSSERSPNISTASSSERSPRRKEKLRTAAPEHPKLQALVDKFHGEVIEVIKPEK